MREFVVVEHIIKEHGLNNAIICTKLGYGWIVIDRFYSFVVVVEPLVKNAGIKMQVTGSII